MRRSTPLLLTLLILGACSSPAEDDTSVTEARISATTALDCSQPGSFTEEAMKALPGTYERVGDAPSNSLVRLTVGALENIPGWGGKRASYRRDMKAPCFDVAAFGDGTGFSGSSLPMTSVGCEGQTGKLTTIFDNPALGAVISLDDGSGLPLGKDVYFVTSSRLEADGTLSGLCLANGGTGERVALTRK